MSLFDREERGDAEHMFRRVRRCWCLSAGVTALLHTKGAGALRVGSAASAGAYVDALGSVPAAVLHAKCAHNC